MNRCILFYLILLFNLCAAKKFNYGKKCTKSLTTCSGSFAPAGFCSGDLIFEDHFDNFDLKRWQHELTMAGGGGYEFQWYVNNRSNSFAENGVLHIRPTLTADEIGEEGLSSMTIDIRGGNPAGLCTNAVHDGCLKTGTPSLIINPIKSARIRTVNSFNYKYGILDVRAKLPAGDWLWPAIWLLPTVQAYGGYPASGEIDLMEARGNLHLIQKGVNIGVEQIGSTLHWGPDGKHNSWRKTHFTFNTPEGEGFDKDYHIYRFEWTPDYYSFSIDSKVVGSVNVNKTFWELGNFTGMENPWRFANKDAPFDQEFYLVLNLAVGGISGYFPDYAVNVPPKPWKNKYREAVTDFWNARDGWIPTWKMDQNEGESSSFLIDYVKIWAL